MIQNESDLEFNRQTAQKLLTPKNAKSFKISLIAEEKTFWRKRVLKDSY